MQRSPGLGLYLLATRWFWWLSSNARGRRAEMLAQVRPERPQGALIWLHAAGASRLASLAQLSCRMAREDPGLRFLVTVPRSSDTAGNQRDGPVFPAGTLFCTAPPEQPRMIALFLAHWRPVLCLYSLPTLRAALIHTVHRHGVPIIFADAQMTERRMRNWRWLPDMASALLRRPDRILAQDISSAERFRALGAPLERLEVTGPIEETTEPLPCNETERESITDTLRARPVWLAIGAIAEEDDALASAHRHAMRFSHRLLLIVVPADPLRGQDLADRLHADGFETALRSREGEPEDETQIFIADTEGEAGLWYRLAPLCYFGGSLSGRGATRNPMEAAALGSAILHGPQLAPYGETFGRLEKARATRRVTSTAELAQAVSDLISPDKAAQLAHNAWQVSTSGAEVTDRVMRLMFDRLDALAEAP